MKIIKKRTLLLILSIILFAACSSENEEKGTIIIPAFDATFDWKGGTKEITYKSNVATEVVIPKATTWVHAIKTRTLSDEKVTITVDENTSFSQREGTITLKGGNTTNEIVITQKGHIPIHIEVGIRDVEYRTDYKGEKYICMAFGGVVYSDIPSSRIKIRPITITDQNEMEVIKAKNFAGNGTDKVLWWTDYFVNGNAYEMITLDQKFYDTVSKWKVALYIEFQAVIENETIDITDSEIVNINPRLKIED